MLIPLKIFGVGGLRLPAPPPRSQVLLGASPTKSQFYWKFDPAPFQRAGSAQVYFYPHFKILIDKIF